MNTNNFVTRLCSAIGIASGLFLNSITQAAELPLTFSAYSYSTDRGLASFGRDKETLYSRGGGAGGGRGFNVAIINLDGYQVECLTNFDTWASAFLDATFEQHLRLVAFLDSIPSNRLVMVAVGDEAGLNQVPPSTNFLNRAEVDGVRRKFRELGSSQLEKLTYWSAWTCIYITSQPGVRCESFSHDEILPTLMCTTMCYTTFPVQVPDPKMIIKDQGKNGEWSLYELTIANIPQDRCITLLKTHNLQQPWEYQGTIPWQGSTYTMRNAFGSEATSIFFKYGLDASPLFPR